MTVSTTIASKTYDGDGATTIFPTVFAFFSETDIEVIERVAATGVETVKTLTTDYTITGGNGAAGNVNALIAPPATVSWTIRRALSETQETDLPVAGSLPSDAVEQIGDRAVMMIQQHSEEIGRGLSFPKTDPSSLDPTLPSSVDRAGKFLSFDSSGNPAVGSDPGLKLADGTAVAPSLTFASDTDVGFFRVADNTMGFAAGGGEMVRFDDFGIAPLDGTAGQPPYTFNSDRDTGLFHNAADQIGIATGGVSRAVFATSTDGAVALIKGGLRIDTARGSSPTAGITIDYGASKGRFDVQSGSSGWQFSVNNAQMLEITANGTVQLNTGSEGTPALTFDSDTDTGLFRAAGNALGFTTGGTERMRLNGNGNVLIGHDTNDDAGNVQGVVQIHGTSTNSGGMNLFSWQSGAGENRLVFAKSRSATPGTHTIVQDGDPLGRIIFAGDDGVDLSSQAADIIANVDGTPGENDLPGELRFGTTAAGSSIPTTHMTIKSDGKVGLGVSTPDGKLHVATSSAGSVSATNGFDDLVVEGSDHTGISILTPSTQAAALAFGDTNDADVSWIEYDHLDDSLNIRVNGSEAARIYSNRDIRLSGSTTALATGATGGFPGIPTMAGDANGTPVNKNDGFAPILYDTNNQELKVYDPAANAWRAIVTVAQ